MEDLLSEDDFLHTPVKPWKWFIMFYIINGITHVASFTIAQDDGYISDFSGTLIILIIPLLSVFLMFFTYKKHKMIPLKTAAISITVTMLLFCIYYIITESFYNHFDIIDLTLGFFFYLFMALICIAIILPIIRRKQKKYNIRFTAN